MKILNQIDPLEGIEVGDIFSSSWGYDQTNVDFFEVVRKTAKMIELREIGGRITETNPGGMSGQARPDPDSKGPSIGLRKPCITNRGAWVSIDSIRTAHKMEDPTAGKYVSWYA